MKDEAPVDARTQVVTQIARAVNQARLWEPGATVLVAVSGGADSLCLLGALVDLRERHHPLAPGELVVASLDHRLRGADGAADIAWVAALAAGLRLRCVVGAEDVRAFARAQRISLEDAARRLRYRFLRNAAREVGAARILVAHTEDDQAETVLLHLLRGTGLNGLAGMRALRGDIARPLLTVSRAQTEAYCAARGWVPRADVSNRDERYLRNRVRHRLLPVLESFNPQIRPTLARMASMLADDNGALDMLTDQVWDAVVASEEANVIALRLDTLAEQPRGLRRRLIRRAAGRLVAQEHAENALESPPGGLEERHMALIERLAQSTGAGATLTLPDGLQATREYTTLRLSLVAQPHVRAAAPASATARAWPLAVPGSVTVAGLGWRVHAVVSETPAGLEGDILPPAPELPPPGHAGSAGALPRGAWRVYADAEVAGARLTVRAWRPGDRFRPLGMARARKLQDVFTDAKVPRDLRRRLPLVCEGDGASERILWVAGLRIGDEFKLTAETRRILVLQAEPLAEPFDEAGAPPGGAQRQD